MLRFGSPTYRSRLKRLLAILAGMCSVIMILKVGEWQWTTRSLHTAPIGQERLVQAIETTTMKFVSDRENLVINDSTLEADSIWNDPKRPNIIFVMADDLGYGDVHYNGGRALTPNLDAMASASSSILLTRYYAGAPVCSPTRGSVLTGRNPNRYCIFHANTIGRSSDFTVPSRYTLPSSEITIAETLKEHGYHTAVFGKWHLGDLKYINGSKSRWPVSHPGLHGFDHWWVTVASAPTLQTNCGCFVGLSCPAGHYGERRNTCSNYYTIDPKTQTLKGWSAPIETDDTFFLYERLRDFMGTVSHTHKPFFVYLPLHTVHHRYIAPTKYRELYRSLQHSLLEADYYGAISAMDEVIGMIQLLLREYGVFNNTMLWFTSDNGPDIHGKTAGLRGRKGSLWEGGIRVPGIIQWPNTIRENRISGFPVVSSDFYPTVCDILGVNPLSKRPIDGMSILPFLRGEISTRSKSIAWAFRVKQTFNSSHAYVLIKGDYKLHAQYVNGSISADKLYNIVEDKQEKHDISSEHTYLVISMKAELDEWRKSVIQSATKDVKCI